MGKLSGKCFILSAVVFQFAILDYWLGQNFDDGQLILDGRTDDMIILNGLNIFPAEIERVLESHPDVDCVAALGLPSQVYGQIPVAAVILKAWVSATPDKEKRRCC